MATRSIDEQAQEIAESFINGNISWAVNQVIQAKNKKIAAVLAVKVVLMLGDDGRASFVRALHNRMVS
ncbi:MAG: hypothetical protein V3W19_13925 [Desulfatiglandales bacterium]